MIEIFQPRWRDHTVLIACYKVKDGDNWIRFTKTPSMKGTYMCHSDIIRSCPVDSNGKIRCYAVPLNELKELGVDT